MIDESKSMFCHDSFFLQKMKFFQLNKGRIKMENYYNDNRIIQALKKEELMDILTFIKEIEFDIKDNLGFDVLWDSLSGKHSVHVHTMLLEWMGYENYNNREKRRDFIKLLESNEIEYLEIGFKDPLIEHFPKIREEIENMLPMNRSTKRWLIMEPRNFKEAIMCLTTKRSKEIRKYYLQLEELVQLYGAYTHKFNENQNIKKMEQLQQELEDTKEHALVLQELLVIATTELYAKNNNFKPGGVDDNGKLRSIYLQHWKSTR